MASVRKRSLKFKDGGRVPMNDAAAPSLLAVADDIDPDEAVRRALKAQRHAEELSRAAQRQQEPPTVEKYIDDLPDLSDQKRAFLKSNPDLLRPENAKIVSQRYAEALHAGIEDDSPELYDHLLNGVRTKDVPEPVFYPEEPPTPVRPAPSPLPTIRKSMPMSAPVSRDLPQYSGQRSMSRMTLSPQEVQIARTSFSDPTGMMTNAEKEMLYLQNKLKLRKMRESGEYPERERN